MKDSQDPPEQPGRLHLRLDIPSSPFSQLGSLRPRRPSLQGRTSSFISIPEDASNESITTPTSPQASLTLGSYSQSSPIETQWEDLLPPSSRGGPWYRRLASEIKHVFKSFKEDWGAAQNSVNVRQLADNRPLPKRANYLGDTGITKPKKRRLRIPGLSSRSATDLTLPRDESSKSLSTIAALASNAMHTAGVTAPSVAYNSSHHVYSPKPTHSRRGSSVWFTSSPHPPQSPVQSRPPLQPRAHSFTALSALRSDASSLRSDGTRESRKHIVDAHELKRQLGHWRQKLLNKRNKKPDYIVHAQEESSKRTFIVVLCYAMMLYGAPSHRLEEYMMNAMKNCQIEGRVNYIPGCMEICFITRPTDSNSYQSTTYNTLVKAAGLDIGKLERVFRVYKSTIHDLYTAEEATKILTRILEEPEYYKPWQLVVIYGMSSATAAIWAYGGHWRDMAPAFVLGCFVGFLQNVVAVRNPLYSNVLEVTSSLVTSFCARAIASIGPARQQKYFCFSSVAESSITLILPGYIILCGSLELQSHSLTSGSSRMFYAVIYSLLLGFGIDVGSQLWGLATDRAPTSSTCTYAVSAYWKILFVPLYLVFQAAAIRAVPKQIPVMVLFGSIGYCVYWFVSQRSSPQIADAVGAFTLGVMAHLFTRTRRGFAFASVITGMMCLVPSGIAAQGGLLAGLTLPLFDKDGVKASTEYKTHLFESFSSGAQMIQVAIGLSVGLYVSALLVYPFGKKRTALFSF
ncbi:pheromone-regulated membrane protein [Schizosaccharomyces japonicus yFS275]|uniref:Pheromone-regulated membrane protein n=1 Tax=Schizosaccharomyces japonicus (strain yFS275 / FY16936) TaxID=402676 RepID=B6K1K7_SCHJY|nr:pheromone-regulated membrane protein [Schizosaccharomyces japonicus yFS275]EEB07038.1 pheromone-regulated membrane protein [Schizosaccharomyces japonicus yFS275]